MEKGKNRNDLLAAGREKLQQYRKKKDQKGGGSKQHGKSSKMAAKPVNADTGSEPKDPLPVMESVPTASVTPPADVETAIGDSATLPVAALIENLVVVDGGSAVGNDPDSSVLPHLPPISEANGEAQDNMDPSSESRTIISLHVEKESIAKPDKEANNFEIEGREGFEKTHPESNPTVEDNASDVVQLQIDKTMSNLTVEDKNDKEYSSRVETFEETSTSVCTESDAVCRDIGIASDPSTSSSSSAALIEQCTNTLPSACSEVNTTVLDENSVPNSTQDTNSLPVPSKANQEEVRDPSVSATSNLTADSMVTKEVDLQSSSSDRILDDCHRTEEVTEAHIKSGQAESPRRDDLCPLPSHSLNEETGATDMQIPITFTGDSHVIYNQEQSILYTEEGNMTTLTSADTGDACDNPELRDLPAMTANLESRSESDVCNFILTRPTDCLEGQSADGNPTLMKQDEFVRVASSNYVVEDVENLKMHLYLTTLTNNILYMRHDAEMEAKSDTILALSDEVSRLKDLLTDSERRCTGNYEELLDCRVQLQTLISEKEVMKENLISARTELEVVNNQAHELQNKINAFQENSTLLSVEVLNCKALVDDLQTENAKLNQRIKFVSEENQTLGHDKEYLVNENQKLASDLMIRKDQLIAALDKQRQLEIDIEECLAPTEELSKENLSLYVCLDAYRMKLRDLDDLQFSLPEEVKAGKKIEVRSTLAGAAVDATLSYTSENKLEPCNDHSKQAPFCQQTSTKDTGIHSTEPGYLHQQFVNDNADDASMLYSLKRHLLDASNITQKLEQAIERLHSQTISLRKSKSASGVSKLIQAFESKVITDDTNETDRITEDKSTDAFSLTKHQMTELKSVLELMDITVEKIESIFREDKDLKKREEKLNLEYEAQKSLNIKLEEKLFNVVSNLSSYKEDLEILQNQLEDLSTTASCDTGGIINQLEFLQGEVLGSLHAMESEKKLTRDATRQTIDFLNASTGLLVSDELDLNSRVQASVNAAIQTIEMLHKGLARLNVDYNTKCTDYDELLKEFKEVQGDRENATRVLLSVCNNFREVLDGTCEIKVERKSDTESDEPLDMMQKDAEFILNWLKVLLDERNLLISAKAELEMEVQNMTENIQDLKEKCDFLTNSLEDEGRAKDKLGESFIDCRKHIESLNGRCITLAKKVEEFKKSYLTEEIDCLGIACNNEVHAEELHDDLSHVLHLESLVNFLLKSHEKALEEVSLSKNHLKGVSSLLLISAEKFLMPLHFLIHEFVIPKITESREEQEKFHHLSSSMLEKESEIQALKDITVKMEEDLKVSRSEYDAKVAELEQSEQRLSSVREKLGIAVAKGKGLIVQRDNLKQTLVDKSGELEKCLQELQTKDNLLHDMEAKLKSYSEVDRVEALESELSYIRNSATAFRDSFLIKDSILQRIEEVLEELDLPESFHSKDTVEKIELLARSAINNSSLLLDDWDKKRDREDSHADAGYTVVDSWQEQAPTSVTSDPDELNRRFEDLQSRFYGLAEHNEMLEQSLVERNSLVQRCEEILDKIDMPSYRRSMESDVRIEWLAKSIGELKLERDSLLEKVENLEESKESLLVNLEELQKKVTELDSKLTATQQERESISSLLDKLRSEYMTISEKESQSDLDRAQLQKDIVDLQKKMAEEERNFTGALDRINKLQDLVSDALPERDDNASFSVGYHIEYFEGLLRRLIGHYKLLSEKVAVVEAKEPITDEIKVDSELKKLKDLLDDKDRDLVALKSQIHEASQSLDLAKVEKEATSESYRSLYLEMEEIIKQKNALIDERDATTEKCQGLISEVDELKKEKSALTGQLNQEEQKCTSMKEKLNLAVRKGKGLIQQRDSLKQNIEELTHKLDQMQKELDNKVGENLSLKNQLVETDSRLQNLSVTLNNLLSVLHAIDLVGFTSPDPAQKLKEIGKLASDWRTAATTSENEAKKSRKAAELLVAELNEVQERVDNLQEELFKAEAELYQCYRQKEIAESANAESQSRLELLVAAHSEERRKEAAGVLKLMASINELRNGYSSLVNAISGNYNSHGSVFRSLEASANSILKSMNHTLCTDDAFSDSSTLLFGDASDKEIHLEFGSSINFHQSFNHNSVVDPFSTAWESLGHCSEELNILKDKIQENSSVIEQTGRHLMGLMEFIQTEITSQKASSESLNSKLTGLEKEIHERETEISLMQKNLTLLFEACRSSVFEIQNRIAQVREEVNLLGRSLPHGMEIPISASNNENRAEQPSRDTISFTENYTKTVAASLLDAVKSSGGIEEEIEEANQRELKTLISELQRELQEKDIQSNRIHEELVSQIKAAESMAGRYLEDLDFTKMEAENLKNQLQSVKEENKSLELRVNELTTLEVSNKNLQQKINQLTELLAAKDQEIEGLMEALDEDEVQMNSLSIRNQELEKLLQEKNLALQSLESSRAKATVKLSNTVNKFDELHQLSESLLAEIESLQVQLQERESEISFLRHEVTRCTDNVISEQEHNKKKTKENFELRQSILSMLSRIGMLDPDIAYPNDRDVQDCTEFIEQKLSSVMDELNDLRVTSQKKESLLQTEKAKVEALTKKELFLESSLRERDTQIESFQRMNDSGLASSSRSGEIVDINQLRNSTASPSSVVPQFRSVRKVNNDQVAIGIDLEQDGAVDNDDDDDDKAHGFKPLTMSKIIPKASRPVTDRIDGLWVSIERLLMRQPTLRLGLILYWIALHAMLAASI